MNENGLTVSEDGLVAGFAYPDAGTEAFCEEAADKIRCVNAARVRFTVMCRLEIGRQINAVAARLPQGRLGPWLAWHFPDWSEEATRRWRVLAQRVDASYVDSPKLLECLHNFESTKAAEEFPGLPERVQLQVLQEKAFTWNAYKAVCWRAAMEERLGDEGLDFGRRHGDVLHAIEEARDDPALARAAEALFEAHAETFAQIADRRPEEMRVEVGIASRREPAGDAPGAQLVEGDTGLWLCKRLLVNGVDTFLPVAAITSHMLVWNGGAAPSVVAAFPKLDDGPVAASWQGAAIDAAVRRLNATTMERQYGEVL